MKTFESVIYPARNKLYRFALRITGDEEDAKDVVQEALIRIWNSREKLREVSNPEAWCMTITRNLAFDYLKSARKRNTERMGSMEVLLSVEPVAEKDTGKDLMKRIEQAMDALPAQQQEILHLRDIEGYTYEEICEILEIKMSQVKITLHRGRKAIRETIMKSHSHGN